MANSEEVEAALAAATAVHEAMGSGDSSLEHFTRDLVVNSDHSSLLEEPEAKRSRKGQSRERRVGQIPTIDLGAYASSSTAPAAILPTDATLGELAGSNAFRVHSKHDEKWNEMFLKLTEYQKIFKSTLVPQCYDQDPRLGRWCHYQRVEYWIFQSRGKAKINLERIARLDSIGFEWDPQRAQWESNFKRLQEFYGEHGHSKVPKGFARDPELANWVRNQRLEYRNMQNGKKTRMTDDRLKRLESIGFKWSNPRSLDQKIVTKDVDPPSTDTEPAS